jgi:hypothetical protein
MTQDEILDALEDNREQFLEAIDDLSDEEMLEPGVVGDWSLRDLIYHLCMWEAELVKLLWQASQGEKPSTIHFSQVSTDEANENWRQQAGSRDLERLLDDLAAVRKQTGRRVSAFSDKDLNDPQRYPWLKGRPLWECIAGDSFQHEAEHTTQVLAWRAARAHE